MEWNSEYKLIGGKPQKSGGAMGLFVRWLIITGKEGGSAPLGWARHGNILARCRYSRRQNRSLSTTVYVVDVTSYDPPAFIKQFSISHYDNKTRSDLYHRARHKRHKLIQPRHRNGGRFQSSGISSSNYRLHEPRSSVREHTWYKCVSQYLFRFCLTSLSGKFLYLVHLLRQIKLTPRSFDCPHPHLCWWSSVNSMSNHMIDIEPPRVSESTIQICIRSLFPMECFSGEGPAFQQLSIITTRTEGKVPFHRFFQLLYSEDHWCFRHRYHMSRQIPKMPAVLFFNRL